jgi:predicted HicB family RNase H-like nuclease
MELGLTVRNLTGRPIEELDIAEWAAVERSLSAADLATVTEYARLMRAAVSSSRCSPAIQSEQKNKDEQLGIRIDSWLKTRLEEFAEREERSVAHLVRRVLRDFVSQSLPQPDGGGSEEGRCEQQDQ